jgi:superoxide dismutase, Cu-Zn family
VSPEAGFCKQSVTIRRICRWLAVAVATAVLALTLTHLGPEIPATTPTAQVRSNPTSLIGSGTLTTPDPTSKAITYDRALAPVDAAILASMTPSDGDSSNTVATMVVAGLPPNRGYAVHAHTNACGPTGKDAGPHYQNHIDPAATPQMPSTNPQYANPRNEIWLDIRTDANGSGTSHTTVPFGFTNRRPGSIVIHEAMTTATASGHAGTAGARVACLTLLPSQ